MKRVAVVGMGHVGGLTYDLLSEKHEVVSCDIDPKDQIRVNACEVAFVCVPTPEGPEMLNAIHEVMSWLTTPVRVIRSTVPPGTCEHFNACHWPEYFGEWPSPRMHGNPCPEYTILSGHQTMAVTEILKTCYPSRHLFYTFENTAVTELAKLAENTFLAVKIELANIVADLCDAYGLDYENVRNVWTMDERIGSDHTTVRCSERGFAGKCLPKDLASFVRLATANGLNTQMLRGCIASNKIRRQ